MDTPEIWASDGRWILFRRLLTTADGPPGLYAVHVNGGPPRYVARAGFFWPREFRFSPDSRTIAAVDGGQLILIDFETGNIRRPLYVRSGIISVDWSPDGTRVVYDRLTSADPNPDSSGIHIFDLVAGTDVALKSGGALLYGKYPRWSPDGREITWIAPRSLNESISVYMFQSGEVRVFFESALYTVLDDLDIHSNGLLGTASYIFRQLNDPGGGVYLIETDGTRLRRFPATLGTYDRIAPDGERFAFPGIDPTDSVAVIFLGRFHDYSRSTVRQLTFYAPPVSATSPVVQKEATRWSPESPSSASQPAWSQAHRLRWSWSGHPARRISY